MSTPPSALKAYQSAPFYFLGLVLYILVYLEYETKWLYPGMILWVMLMITLVSLSVHLLIGISNFKKASEKMALIVAFVISFIVGNNAAFLKEENLLFVTVVNFLLVFGAKDIDFRSIVKTFFIVGGTYCAITVVSSVLGIIENIEDISLTREIETDFGTLGSIKRLCFGYGWSTNMANHVFFVLLSSFYYIQRHINIKETLLLIVIGIFIWIYTGSKLSTILIMMIAMFSLLYKTKNGNRFLSSKVMCYAIILCIPFFAFISYYATNAYDETDLMWFAADVVVTGRLGIGHEALQDAGVSLLGQFYMMYGSARDDGTAYNYIDCSYIQLLVIYGLVYTIMVVLGYVLVCRSAYKRKDVLLLYSVFFAGVSGVISQHFIEMYMNPFLIALFASHKYTKYDFSQK